MTNQKPLSYSRVMSSPVTAKVKTKTQKAWGKLSPPVNTPSSHHFLLFLNWHSFLYKLNLSYASLIPFHERTYPKFSTMSPSTPSPTTQTHVLAYPFPTSGHVIPLLDLTKALVARGIYVTVLITPSNLPLIPTDYSPLLQTLVLPPPQFPDPNQNRLVAIITSMRHQHYHTLLRWAQSHPSPPSAIISDFFLGWTQQLARDLGVPRLVFSPSGAFALSISFSMWRDLPQNEDPDNPNSIVSFPNIPNTPVYPWWQISALYRENKRGQPEWELHRENLMLNLASWGAVFNTFTELERVYLDNVKREFGYGDRVWAVGPLLPPEDDSTRPEDRGGSSTVPCRELFAWLDSRRDGSVVYVCFGSRTVLTSTQMEVLTRALELSGVHFILSVRGPGVIPNEFRDRVGERGFVIEGWAPQLAILGHGAVGAFLTHCGWNSVLEGLVAGVVMLTWPMGADQYTNAKLVVDQLGSAMRAAEGTENVPEAEELARRIERSVEKSAAERVRAAELREAGLDAMKKKGSSGKELDALVKQLSEL